MPEDGPTDRPPLATRPLFAPPPPGPFPPPVPARSRRARRVLLVTASAVVALAVGLGVGLGTSGSQGVDNDPRAAAALLKSVVASANTAGGFHYASSSTTASASSSLTQVTIGDAAPSSGRQDITVGSSRFTVLVVGQTAYFEGDAVATSATLGLPAATATRYAGQWISLEPGDGPYQSVYAAVTTSSALHDNITLLPRSQVSGTRYHDMNVIVIAGSLTPIQGQAARGTASLYVTASRPHLPVAFVEKGTVGGGSSRTTLSSTIQFSRWGHRVPVHPPSGAIPFSSLGPSSGAPNGMQAPPGPTFNT